MDVWNCDRCQQGFVYTPRRMIRGERVCATCYLGALERVADIAAGCLRLSGKMSQWSVDDFKLGRLTEALQRAGLVIDGEIDEPHGGRSAT